jgi:hypothetical protein
MPVKQSYGDLSKIQLKLESVMSKRGLSLACLLFVAEIFLSGCGSIKSASVAVTASATTVDATDATTLTAVVTNDKNAAGVSWSVSGGGTLSSTTTTGATYTAPAASNTALTVTVTATSVADPTKTGTATITVPAAPAITTGALAAGTVGTAYSATMAGSGGISPYTWTITSGTLPAGLSMNSAGVISGTPTAAGVGATNLTFLLTDSGTATALTATTTLGLTIDAAPAIGFTGTVPATAKYQVAYTGSAAASGGAGALTYSISAGTLPTGLSLNTATGAITGTPTAVGTFGFTVKAADAFGDSLTKVYSIVVTYTAVVVTPATLPTGYDGSLYTQTTLTATGGSGTGFTFALANGTVLPLGLNLSASGVISGTPTATGTTNFTIKATDSASNTGNGNFSITVNAGVSITTSLTLPTGYVNGNYSQTLAATGGSGTGYTWKVTSGSNLPAGLNLSTAGVLSGKPTAAGTPSFSITATDSVGNTASATFSMTVAAGVTINVPSLPAGYPGTSYPLTTVTASGGTNTGFIFTWAAASGSTLPAGLSLGSNTGNVTGTPTNATAASVVSSVVVTATDSIGNSASTTVSITIEASVAITTSTLNPGTISNAYSQQLAASGGSGTGYVWTTTGTNNLASFGLTLSSTGLLSSTNLGATTGTVNFTAQVSDSQSHSTTAALSFTIYSTLTITTTTLPATNVGVGYSQSLVAAGGSGTGFSWTATSSNLSTYGLALSTAGVITGTPTQSGTATFTANVTDSASNTAHLALTITVYGALSLPAPDPLSLPSTGYTNVAYTGTIAASGGSGNYSWLVTGLSDNLTPNPVAGTLTISGTPGASPATVTFNVKLTDTTTNASVTQNGYNIAISTPVAVALPTPGATVPGAATENQPYNGAITVTGGVPPYTWSINGTTVTGGGLALSNGLSASSSGGTSLTITGTPTTLTAVPLTNVKVQDSIGSNQTNSYSIAVNSAGSNVSGNLSLINTCGSVTVPTITVKLLTNPGAALVQTQTTDGSGNYTFTAVPNGTYTITPSITGPSSIFYPASTNVTVNNVALTGENFQASLGYTVSGTVSYSGSNTGRIYLTLNNTNCSGNGGTGTSIASAGAFTIRGVAPGTYNLQTFMDLSSLAEGSQNTSDPTGSASGLTVSNANLTGQAITLTDNNPTVVPSSNPTIRVITATDQGVVITYKPTLNSNNVETATSYDVQWSTSSTFATSPVIHNFKATGGHGSAWILNDGTSGVTGNPLANGTPYYFEARARNAVGPASGWTVYGGGTPTSVTPGASTTGNQVQGTVTIPNGITPAGPLYVGFINTNTNTAYATRIAAPTAGANAYSVYVPSDSNSDYYNFAILDQNNDGLIDAGDVDNTDHISTTIAITTALTGQNPALPTGNTTAAVTTQYYQSTSSGGSSSGYNLNFDLRAANKLPVTVTLSSGPNMINPIDIGACTTCGSNQFNYSSNIGNAVPAVGDSYNFTVTYSDGSQDTGTTVNGAVTAFGSTGAVVGASDLVTNLAPTGTSSTSLTPTLSWTYPAGASTAGYAYSFYFSGNTGNAIWQLPNSSSNSNGFTYAQVPSGTLTWNVDPISGDNSSVQGTLNTSTQYTWQIQVQDSNGNGAQTQTWYQP